MPLDAQDKLLLERIENDFTYHPPKGDQAIRYERLRANAMSLAKLFIESCPECRERGMALTQLEESIFWINAGISRHESEG